MLKSTYKTAPLIFLDTNVIHNGTSYLLLAQKYNLTPFSNVSDFGKIKSELKKDLPNALAENILSGLKYLAYIQKEIKNNEAVCYTSRLSIAEMWHGRLDGQAHIRMSLAGMPFRQRQRQGDISHLVSMKLTENDYELVNTELDGMLEIWESELGIRLFYVEDEIKSSDLYSLALEIQKLTFLDVIDCLLFAGSLALISTSFLTSDKYLFDVIGYIKNPKSIEDRARRALWTNAKKRLLEILGNYHINSKKTPKMDETLLPDPLKSSSLNLRSFDLKQ